MKETQFSTEKRVLMAMRKTLAKIVRDLTPSDSATRYPLSDDTVNDVKMCFDLIAAREKELAAEGGVDVQDKPRFIDEKNSPKVVSMSGLSTTSSGKANE